MTLRDHLDAAAAFDAEYSHNLASHLPMTLTALSRLGADDAQMARFAAAYTRRLHAAPAAEPWPTGDGWQQHLGDPRVWPAYRSLFNDWFDHEGATAVLPVVLPVLFQGVGAAAFHGPIRVAYALAAGHSHELADALAYWACRWFSLPVGASTADRCGGRERDPARVLAAHALQPATAPLIAERMVQVGAQPGFGDMTQQLRVDAETTLQALALLAARAYVASRDFTVLHLVTSAHAVRTLLPWVEADEALQALRHYWCNYAAGFVGSGILVGAAPALGAASGAVTADKALLAWADLAQRAIERGDDHLVKLVDSCREQQVAYGGDVWLAAARRGMAGGEA